MKKTTRKPVRTAKEQLEAIIAEARALRQAREEADAIFLLYLRRIEMEKFHLIESCGYGSFAQFLNTNDLCSPARFENFKRGVEFVGEQEAERLGANPVIALANTMDRKNVPEFVQAVTAFTKAHDGTRPSLQTAQKMLRQVDPRKEVPQDLGRQAELARLRHENAQLRTQVARLTRENEQLKRQVAKKAA